MTSCSNVLDKITIALLYVAVALFILLQRYENTSSLCSLAAMQYKYLCTAINTAAYLHIHNTFKDFKIHVMLLFS